jgi:hypothetical protein
MDPCAELPAWAIVDAPPAAGALVWAIHRSNTREKLEPACARTS